ncbi:MAG: mechanosensitive ion channel [Candidatus Palauibacterales bacterium]|nr:mechanosensitive ion channel [Candidatus Palauibacterales bacterium]
MNQAVDPGQALQRALDQVTPGRVLATLLILGGAWLVSWTASQLIDRIAERYPRARLRLKQAGPLIRVVMWVGALYVIVFGVFRPEQAATLAGLVAGAAIGLGLAAQDLLRDLVGGLTLIFDRPFGIGDRVRIGEHYGEVTAMGLRSVRLRTPEDTQVAVPNSTAVRSPVSNASSGSVGCQVVSEIWLPADASLVEVRRLAFEAAASSRYADLSRPIEVAAEAAFVRTFLVLLRVKAYVLDHRDEVRFRTDVVQRVQGELVRRGIIDRDMILPRD